MSKTASTFCLLLLIQMFFVLNSAHLHAACVKDQYETQPEDLAQLKRDADNGGGRLARILWGTTAILSAGTSALIYETVKLFNDWDQMACNHQNPLSSSCNDNAIGSAFSIIGAVIGSMTTVTSCAAAISKQLNARPHYAAYQAAYNVWDARRRELKDLVGAVHTHALHPRLIEIYQALNDEGNENRLDILDIRLHILFGDDNEELCPRHIPKNSTERIEWLRAKKPVEISDFLAIAPRYPGGYPNEFLEYNAFFAAMKPLAQEIHNHEIHFKKMASDLNELTPGLEGLERNIASKEQQIREIKLKAPSGISDPTETRIAMDPDLVATDFALATGELSNLQDRAAKLRTAVETQRLATENARRARDASYVRFNDTANKFVFDAQSVFAEFKSAEVPPP
jgi:hypothetical protein